MATIDTLDRAWPAEEDTGPTPGDGWGWLLALGLVQVALGTFALSATFLASLASALMLGVSLLISGILQVLHAINPRDRQGFSLHLALGILYVVAGGILVCDPLGATLALTLVLGFYFIAAGVMRVSLAIRIRSTENWAWMLLTGLLDLVLGGLICSGWPGTAFWVLGAFVGVDLLMNGWAFAMLSFAMRDATRRLAGV